MAVPRALISDYIRGRLGEHVLAEAMSSLFAVDCQTCGSALGGAEPAVIVDDWDVFLMLGLHHRGCAASDWRGSVADVGVTVMRHSSAATLSFTTLAVMLPGAVAGKPFSKPLLVVNPSLEAVMLRQDTSGRWRVHLDRQYADAGMVSPSRQLHLDRPITGATAVLAGGEVAVRVRGVLPQEFIASTSAELTARIAELGGVLFAVTQALDPAAIARLSDLQPVLTGDRSLLGWVALHQLTAVHG